MGVGRFVCVALPVLLTVASIIALLIAALSGVAHSQLWLFQLDTRNLSISPADAAHFAGKVAGEIGPHVRDVVKTDNITAADLNLAGIYEVDLWGYCTMGSDGKRQCTKARFDWASKALNTSSLDALNSTAGVKIELPRAIKSAVQTFRTLTKWTEVAFVVALVALGVQLALGILANCSRAVSCLTWLLSSVTAILVGVAAGLATAMATVVVGAVEGSAKYYGVKGQVGGRFLSTVWIATAFAIVSGFFWVFTICCCKPDHRHKTRSPRNVDSDGEKLLPTGAYRPISNSNFEMAGGQQGGYSPQHAPPGYSSGPRHPSGQERTDLAYEPYSHRA